MGRRTPEIYDEKLYGNRREIDKISITDLESGIIRPLRGKLNVTEIDELNNLKLLMPRREDFVSKWIETAKKMLKIIKDIYCFLIWKSYV